MFKSIYRKIREDFSFLQDFGFFFWEDARHYVEPSVMFRKDKLQMRIGFTYEDHRFFISLYDLSRVNCYAYDNSQHLLEDITLYGTSYKDQVDQVKKVILRHLQTEKIIR